MRSSKRRNNSAYKLFNDEADEDDNDGEDEMDGDYEAGGEQVCVLYIYCWAHSE